MSATLARPATLLLSGCLAVTACSAATRAAPGQPAAESGQVPSVTNPVAGSRYPHTRADVEFMSGMIPHHAQAVLIAGWAPSHGASEAVQRLCERIVVAQRDEIATMRQWLQDRGEPVPPPDATHHRMVMGGVEHDMLMPGMLTDEELARLDRARGVEFDRLFLTHMIRHHEGALVMVDQLFASPGAGQDDIVYKFVSDVWADQSTEIDFMLKMLADLSGRNRP
ncbi:MAG: DUF305 domain-containing protein [Gemmatimonadetes bacterium]|nr:DUF305 domain-containing protein [Gemmatimonadota bacterium]